MPSDSASRSEAGQETNGDDLSSSPGTSGFGRVRTESESSDKQARFFLPGTAGSPPKVMTMHEVMDCVKNIGDMTMAHEIAINPDFKLKPFEPSENSLEKRVKDMIHQAFWDILRKELGQSPPCYDQAIQLLSDVKEYLEQIFLWNKQKIMDHICSVLDSNLIRQQAEQGCLDFKSYANFVIDIMAKSCAPIRDEQVAKLREIDDVVDTFRGIMETLSLMRLDLANCLLDATRNEVVANSVEYEKKKFKKHLETYTLGFPATEKWLSRNIAPAETAVLSSSPGAASSNGHTATPSPTKQTISNAYLELMDWNAENEFPELLAMDESRINTIQSRALRLCACVSTMAIASGVPTFVQNPNIKKAFARELDIITENIKTDKDLLEGVDNIWLQMRTSINKFKADQQSAPLDEQTEQTLKNQVLQIAKPDAPVRSLMWKRLKIYLRLSLYSKQAPPPPPGFQEFEDELESLCTAFKLLTSYNYAVFGDYYNELIEKLRA